MKITYDFLKQEPQACALHRRRFAQIFRKSSYPDGVEITPENIDRATKAGLDIEWLLSVKFPELKQEYNTKYHEFCKQWQVDYRKVCNRAGSTLADLDAEWEKRHKVQQAILREVLFKINDLKG